MVAILDGIGCVILDNISAYDIGTKDETILHIGDVHDIIR
jgi:hypothetical protein